MNARTRQRSTIAFAVILVAACAITGARWLGAGDDKESEKPTTSWQHMALTHEGKDLQRGALAAKINEVGRQGWELVCVETFVEEGTTTKTVFFFKKPL